MVNKIKWPSDVPKFYAKDICKGQFSDGDKRCAWEHIWKTFGLDSRAAKEATRVFQRVNKVGLIASWNDREDVTKGQIARALNKMVKELGYVGLRRKDS